MCKFYLLGLLGITFSAGAFEYVLPPSPYEDLMKPAQNSTIYHSNGTKTFIQTHGSFTTIRYPNGKTDYVRH